MKQPNFFIVGAPKCGTTSIYRWLSEHPEVFFSAEKEPHFFSPDIWKTTQTIDQYEALFQNAEDTHIAVGEASTHYIYSNKAIPSILKYNASAKFIVCIRNPMEMAPSMHSERVFAGLENQTDFTKAWRLIGSREMGKRIPLAVQSTPILVNYQKLCSLGAMLEKLYALVDREKVLTVFMDDIATQPAIEYVKITNFLGLTAVGKTDFQVANSRKITAYSRLSQFIRLSVLLSQKMGKRRKFGIASKIRDLNLRARKPAKSASEKIDTDVLLEMYECFESDIQLLQSLTGKDLSHWKK